MSVGGGLLTTVVCGKAGSTCGWVSSVMACIYRLLGAVLDSLATILR